ncbi:dolichyl pyrophosphate Man9GlcNAc2 alpha-1,3-glucosyltransferase isoform X1 [Centruroides vittatus]|uniref:dolichyl pyrophosphate Man9GlcNAc2 alpha-1,3-glucosyltransferase isoform X1 n=1 Tax=Centruroides vittatus TaxID=120091 RepID=UPI00350ECC3F
MVFKKYEVDDVLYFGIALGLLLRWSTSTFSYSGADKPPMYGDYEAQRHWMEITVNLPVKEWYQNSTKNDLLYWGLDYPPLTAYHSLLCGYIAQWFDKSWVALKTSRGYESYDHKIFMRATVILADILIYIPAIILYWTRISKPYRLREKAIAATITLLYPGFILIDHGHFQYNCISLGLCLWAIFFLIEDMDVVGAIAFTLALNYKQMELYHAFPFFFYLFGKCRQQPFSEGLKKFIQLALIVILTTAVCWAPFLRDFQSVIQVVHRLFPFARGLYEDKVANVWYCLSVFIKLKQLFSVSTLALISGITTLTVLLPSMLHLLHHPSIPIFQLSLVNSSLIFFLCSYQVHEKSILLAALPALLLIDDYPVEILWFLNISTFSMFPLISKDRLIIPYFALSVLFFIGTFKGMGLDITFKKRSLKNILFILSILGGLLLNISAFVVKPPAHYPHIHSLLNAVYSCIHFIGFAVYFQYVQWNHPYPNTTRLKEKKSS